MLLWWHHMGRKTALPATRTVFSMSFLVCCRGGWKEKQVLLFEGTVPTRLREANRISILLKEEKIHKILDAGLEIHPGEGKISNLQLSIQRCQFKVDTTQHGHKLPLWWLTGVAYFQLGSKVDTQDQVKARFFWMLVFKACQKKSTTTQSFCHHFALC